MKQTAWQRSSRWLVILVALFLLAFVGNAARGQRTGGSLEVRQPLNVSLISLIAAPERYDGKLVRAQGFLSIEFESPGLYLHEEDYRRGLLANAFALDLSRSQKEQFKSLSLKYVLIEGTVRANGPGRELVGWGGDMNNITRLEVWSFNRRVPQR